MDPFKCKYELEYRLNNGFQCTAIIHDFRTIYFFTNAFIDQIIFPFVVKDGYV